MSITTGSLKSPVQLWISQVNFMLKVISSEVESNLIESKTLIPLTVLKNPNICVATTFQCTKSTVSKKSNLQ